MSTLDRWLLPDGIDEILPPQAAKLEHLRRDLLDLYLQDPERFTVGQLPMRRSSTSPFIGVFDPQDRADIVAYIAANGKQKKRR